MANGVVIQDYKYGFKKPEKYVFKSKRGLDKSVVEQISSMKSEPQWMREQRLRALEIFFSKKMPTWGADLSSINFGDIYYYIKPTDSQKKSWSDLPREIKETYDAIGIPEAEKKYLAGVTAQYESESVYHSFKKRWEEKGVIFLDMDSGLKQYPDLVKQYFGRAIPAADNKFAALNSAVWSGGCLTEEAQIFTVNPGVKKINQVEAGDRVFALNDQGKITTAKVLAKIHSGKKKVYDLEVGGRTLQASGNHKFLKLEKSATRLDGHGKRWYTIWRSLDELKKGDLIAISKCIPDTGKSKKLPPFANYLKNNHFLSNIYAPSSTSEDLLWLLGLWIGDGNIHYPYEHHHMCYINFAIPESNGILRKETLRVIEKLFGLKVKTVRENSFTINSKALGKWLESIGIKGKAKTKRIPSWIFGLPIRQRLAFLAGLLDSDGFLENEGKIIKFELANLDLIKDIKLLAISCGLYSNGRIVSRLRKIGSLGKIKGRVIHTGRTYSCRITGAVYLVRSRDSRYQKKLNLAKREKGTANKYRAVTGENFQSATTEHLGFAPIRSKKLAGIKDVYDIQVDNFANFIANGIVVHNSFIYVPKGVSVDIPLQAYFRINAAKMGQFERTLIIVDEGAYLHYVESCSAPIYTTDSLHAAVVEIFVKKGARCRYTTIQNWSSNVYNLVTKRSFVEEEGTMEWIDGNIGSEVTAKYPSCYLVGRGARGEVLSLALAGTGQHQDAGGKLMFLAPDTSGEIISKSVSHSGGRTSYRGLVKVIKGAERVKCNVRCDALILDEASRSDTYPTMQVDEDNVRIGHEASVSRIDAEQLFYLMSRGLSEIEATSLIVNGFIEPIVKELPLEYAVELNRLIQLNMEGSVG